MPPRAEFDPVALMEEAINSGLDPSIFDDVVHHDTLRAKNIAEWFTSQDFLGITPYPRQLQIASMMAEDWCPACSDRDWFENLAVDVPITEIFDKVVFLEFGICPQCKKSRLDFMGPNWPFHAPYELDVCAGQRGGKSLLTAAIATYAIHRVLMLPSPSEYFELVKNSTLMATFVALTATQADETLWQAYKDLIGGSTWFTEYHKFLDAEGKRIGAPLYKKLDTYIWYEHKRIYISYQGADVRTLRGRTRIFAAIDELGWFDAEAGSARIRANAKGTWDALDRSLTTIRGKANKFRKMGAVDVPDAWMCNISSPAETNDMIMQLIREGERDTTKKVFHLPTWEMNPDITEEWLAQKRVGNPAEFDRDFGAIPPLANNPFIGDVENVIKISQRADISQLVKTVKDTLEDDFGQSYVYRRMLPGTSDKTVPRVLSVDAGETYNSFAIAVARLQADGTAIDFLCEIRPENDKPVHFPRVFDQLIVPLCQAYNIRLAVYDRWQSTDQVQRLREYGVEAIRYSMRTADFYEFRARILSSNLLLPVPEIKNVDLKELAPDPSSLERMPVVHALLQMATVREVGRRIVKPLRGQDDLFRTIALSDYVLNDTKLRKKFRLASIAGHRRQTAIGVTAGLSMGWSRGSGKRALVGKTGIGLVKTHK